MFKVGDVVRCINTGQAGNHLTVGKLYTVTGRWKMGNEYIGDNGVAQAAYDWRFELVESAPKAAAIAGGLQEHSVGEYYPLAAVMYEHGDERIITIENLQTGEVGGDGSTPFEYATFEQAYSAIEAGFPILWIKGRVFHDGIEWRVAEPANPVRVTRLRNMLHRG